MAAHTDRAPFTARETRPLLRPVHLLISTPRAEVAPYARTPRVCDGLTNRCMARVSMRMAKPTLLSVVMCWMGADAEQVVISLPESLMSDAGAERTISIAPRRAAPHLLSERVAFPQVSSSKQPMGWRGHTEETHGR